VVAPRVSDTPKYVPPNPSEFFNTMEIDNRIPRVAVRIGMRVAGAGLEAIKHPRRDPL